MSSTEPLDFDPDALREKYRAERDKRLRDDGDRQYLELAGDFARYAESDPYADPGFTREPITDEIEVAIIGGGFSGLLAGARLQAKRASTTSASSRPAATSAAPGTGTAIPAPSATSRATATCRCSKSSATCRRRSTPTSTRSSSTASASATHYDLYDLACFQTRVHVARWDEDERRWHIATNRGDDIRARFVVMALGHRQPGQAAGHPRHRELRGPQLPHQPLGLRLHRRRHATAA